jgi:hypothetical protein
VFALSRVSKAASPADAELERDIVALTGRDFVCQLAYFGGNVSVSITDCVSREEETSAIALVRLWECAAERAALWCCRDAVREGASFSRTSVARDVLEPT